MAYPTGNQSYDAAARVAELAFQNAQPFANQGAATAASVARLQAQISAGQSFGISTINQQSALNAIRATGSP
jgi:hypothetical protein